MSDDEQVLGGSSPVRLDGGSGKAGSSISLGGSSTKLGGSGVRLEGSSVLRDGSSLRKVILQLRTERVAARAAASPEGKGYVVLVIRGDRLALGESPVATEQPLPAGGVILFEHRTCAALWSALSAWHDVADGKSPRAYSIRPIRFTGATYCYTLRIVEGPLLCDLANVIEARQFVIPARGLERPKGSALARPHQESPAPRGLR